MEFQKERVFTALNADELKVGSKVFAANSIDMLKRKVHDENDIYEVKKILEEGYERRFQLDHDGTYPFVYLISESEKTWIAYLCRESSNPENYYLTACRSDRWEFVKEEYGAKTKLFEGTEDECNKWYTSRRHFANVIAAWEDGKAIQFKYDDCWIEAPNPEWNINIVYRIKPEGLKWTDLKIGDIIQNESSTHTMMVTGIDYREESKCHIFIGEMWLDDDDLNYWKKVE